MSGIFGCWHFTGQPVDAGRLDACLERIAPSGPAGIERWSCGPIALGCKSSGSTLEIDCEISAPASIAAPHTVCVFDGRIDNRRDLIALLQSQPLVSSSCSDRWLAAAAYERFGERFVDHIDGDFALAVFDRQAHRLLVARDRLGARPVCYACTAQGIHFGSEAGTILAYLGEAPVPDETTLADFLLYFQAEEGQGRSFFRGVQALPPAHVLIATPAGTRCRRYFDFDPDRAVRFADDRDYAQALHEHVVGAVRRRLRGPSPVAVAVSGGLDSSYLYCVAQRLVRTEPGLCPAVIGFNYGGAPGTPSDERAYVERLEGITGQTIERIAPRTGFISRGAAEAAATESPTLDPLAEQSHAVRQRVREAGARRFLTGHWGDQVLSDSDYLLDLLRAGRWALLKQHGARWGQSPCLIAARYARDLAARRGPAALVRTLRRRRGLDARCEAPWFTPDFRRRLLERFHDRRFVALGRTSHARAIYRQSRIRYHVHCLEWNARLGAAAGLDMAFPYLDRHLIQFLMGIPGEVQSLDGVSRGLMRAAMRGTVPEEIVARRTKGEFTHFGNASVDREFPAIRELLGPSSLSARSGFVDGAALAQVLPSWRDALATSASSAISNRIVELCGIELFLQFAASPEMQC